MSKLARILSVSKEIRQEVNEWAEFLRGITPEEKTAMKKAGSFIRTLFKARDNPNGR